MPGKVLIVDDVATNRIILRVKLSAAFYRVVQARSGAEAAELLASEKPDLMIVAQALPDMSGVALCRQIARRGWAAGRIPMLLTAARPDPGLRLDALESGAVDVLDMPVDDALLQARLRSLLRNRESVEEMVLRDHTRGMPGLSEGVRPAYAPPERIALIAATRTDAAALRPRLPGRRRHVDVHGGPGFWKSLSTAPPPDVCMVAISAQAPERGLQLLAALRAQPATRNTAILAVLDGAAPGDGARALDLGANDLMRAHASSREMTLRLDALIARKQTADRLRLRVKSGLRAALTDPLTGLYNRRYAMPQLESMADAARAAGHDLAVMIADLDHFKAINDRHGHAAGDAVLQALAGHLRGTLRGDDLLARIGGEEFLIAMPGIARKQAQRIARRLCRQVAALPCPVAGIAAPLRVTMSVGVAMGPGADTLMPVEALLDQADRALYGAKARGRNRVTLSSGAAA
ncbi:diguanylate cyclase [Sediminimonas sp.]|uniref:diguanylate cyclase n=1 Tax=Sediminimonas sp. TaxID=2823379 RepID=UPI0025CF8367|nr:diguanylate cyclase [Sediminimonas sp.]